MCTCMWGVIEGFFIFFIILMKYVMLFPNNLNRIFISLVVEHCINPVKHFLINIIYKLSSAIL